MRDIYCDGCRYCETEPPVKQGANYLTHCTDPDKPVRGLRRVVDARGIEPMYIRRPTWCRGKKKPLTGVADR